MATITLSPSALVFPSTPVGGTSAAQTITLTNSGAASLSLTALTTGGTHPGDFTRAGTCTAGGSVGPGTSCTLVYTFAPGATGSRSAQLSIASNNSGGNVTITLNGTGVNNTPAISLSATSLTFGAVQVGQTSAARSVRSPGGLSIRDSGGSAWSLSPVVPYVTFAPPAAGAASATMSIAHAAAGSPSAVALSGTGSAVAVPVVSLSRPNVTFAGVLALNQSSTNERVVFSNAGPGSVTIGALTLTGDFAVAGGAGTACSTGLSVPAGGSCSIDLRFTPTAAGVRNGTLTVASGGTPADAVSTLTGTGSAVAAPAISAPAQLDFGKLPVGAAPAAQPLTITNSGSTNLVVNALSLSGPFTVTGTGSCGATPFTLTPMQSCALQVTFNATSGGMQTGALTVQSNCPTATTVNLTGEVATSASSGAAGATNVGFGGGSLSTEVLALLALFLAVSTVVRGATLRAAPRGRTGLDQ
ncbi:MAG: choice-of-anchor D domain-containing protein [Burkholderiaceae bacterium]|nr:choice-of-anchor D domain-containing protein [Burkholderiaceae bacterium]